VCDFGIVSIPEPRVVVAACTRGEASLTRSERALREIGAALTASGLLTPSAS
jgi:beta-lactamase class A